MVIGWSTLKAEFNGAFLYRHKDSFVIFLFDFSNETKIHNDFNIIISFLWTAQHLNYKPTDRLLLAHLTRYIDI